MNNIIVEWNVKALFPAPRASRPNRRETRYRVTCLHCDNVYWLRRSDALEDNPCSICQKRAAGTKGYWAAVAKHGRSKVLEAIQKRELENPSRPERTVLEWLSEWHAASVERQVLFDGLILDAVIAGSVVIEVNGYWHNLTRQDRDRRLVAAWPGRVIFVDSDTVVKSPEAAREQLHQDIQRAVIDLHAA